MCDLSSVSDEVNLRIKSEELFDVLTDQCIKQEPNDDSTIFERKPIHEGALIVSEKDENYQDSKSSYYETSHLMVKSECNNNTLNFSSSDYVGAERECQVSNSENDDNHFYEDGSNLDFKPAKIKEPVECVLCLDRFTSKEGLDFHMTHHSNLEQSNFVDGKNRGELCVREDGHDNISFGSKISKISSNTNIFECAHCMKQFKHKISIVNHLRIHQRNAIKCQKCNKVFISTSSLKRHLSSGQYGCRPSNKNLTEKVCPICHKFLKHTSMFNHLQIHTNYKIFECEYCKKRYQTKFSLLVHTRTHTGERPYGCTFCNLRFTHKPHLTTHLRIHTKESPYLCCVCSRGFKRKENLNMHLLQHTAERRFECEICCKRFPVKQSFLTHMKIHNPENKVRQTRKYGCNECGTQCATKEILVKHLKRHEGNGHLCNICGKTYLDSRNLNQHLKCHGAKQFECAQCGNFYATKHTLRVHMDLHNKHGNRFYWRS